jgi:hypothetical protein
MNQENQARLAYYLLYALYKNKLSNAGGEYEKISDNIMCDVDGFRIGSSWVSRLTDPPYRKPIV